MPITSEIEFEQMVGTELKRWRVPTGDLSVEEIEAALQTGIYVTIVNTFHGKVPLSEMISSTSESVAIMSNTSKPIDVLAIMEMKSNLSMSVGDITKTPTIVDFANHPHRGTTVSLIYEKSAAQFFLNIANHLMKNANFAMAKNLEDAYGYIHRHREARASVKA